MNVRARRYMQLSAAISAATLIALSCAKEKEKTEETAEQATHVDPEAPPIVVAMIDAHGGMAAWRSAEAVSFEDEFGIPGAPSAPSRVTVEQSRRRAYIDFPGTGQSIVWDGKRAWSTDWTNPTPPRFLALLNYYFVNLPWLTMDPGVKLADAGTDSLWSDPTPYRIVHMTFMPGTGDTPDDRYRLYIDPESKRLKACAYTVTYRALLPDSVASTPEHILVYDEWTRADGLLVPAHYTIYSTDQDTLYTCSIRDWSFQRPFDEGRMTMPDSAVVDETVP